MIASLCQREKKGEYVGMRIESMMLTGTQGSGRTENRPAFNHSNQKEAKSIEIDGRGNITSIAFLADGKHVVSGGDEGKIRRWRAEDGRGVGKPMNAGSSVGNIAVSQDGKWVVSGTTSGQVTVWNAESHSKVTEWKAHRFCVGALDVSPDGTRIATGSDDNTLSMWSLATGERLVDPLEHDGWVVAVKFSPNGRFIATAAFGRDIRVYASDSFTVGLLVDVPVKVEVIFNQSLVWASDSKRLFALSRDGKINCFDASSGRTRSEWPIHSSDNANCIALASNGTFIAVSAGSSVSFWDTTTHEPIGSVVAHKHTHGIWSMAISADYDLLMSGGSKITVHNLRDVLPSPYCDDVSALVSKARCTSWVPNHRPLFLGATGVP